MNSRLLVHKGDIHGNVKQVKNNSNTYKIYLNQHQYYHHIMASNVARSILTMGIIQRPISSSLATTAVTGSHIAQRKFLTTLHIFKASLLPSSSSAAASQKNFAANSESRLSSLSVTGLVASPHKRSTYCRHYTTMAAAGPIFSKNNFNTAALLPQVDAFDESVDPVQRQLLEEQCIVLNDKDQVIGHDTKRNCHKIVNGDVLLHRAFSVFLFNGKGELLLQQRSKTKITFPLMWTNTCCSHPLYTSSELEEKDAIGVRRAARRRLQVELGIPEDSISLDEFQYLTRIHYKALSNSIWGEHEIDYILFLQKDDLEIKLNPDEIQEIRWVTIDKVKEMVEKENVTLTPWFDLILKNDLPTWWKKLKHLKEFEDHENINRM